MSKRVTDEADRARMLRLCDELRAEALLAPTDAGLKVVPFDSLTEFYPHLAALDYGPS